MIGLSSTSVRRRGYSLIELLVALGLLAAGLGAAASLSLTINKQDELNLHRMRALNFAENAARLWQMGVAPSSVLLTERDSESSNIAYSFSTVTTVNVSGVTGDATKGVMERTTLSVTWTPPGSSAASSLTFNLLRPITGGQIVAP